MVMLLTLIIRFRVLRVIAVAARVPWQCAHEQAAIPYKLLRECSAPKQTALENRCNSIFSQDEAAATGMALEWGHAARGIAGDAFGNGRMACARSLPGFVPGCGGESWQGLLRSNTRDSARDGV